MRLLLEKGVKLDAYQGSGLTCLHKAAEKGHTSIARLLIEKGADVEATTEAKVMTALHYSAMNGHTEIAQLLIENGASVDTTSGENGWTALHWTVGDRHVSTARLLIENGAEVEATADNGLTVLQHTFEHPHWEKGMIELLLESGADITTVPLSRVNFELRRAAEKNEKELVRIMLDKGLDLRTMAGNYGDYGRWALEDALRAANYEIADLLIERGADTDRLEMSGFVMHHRSRKQTPMQWAARNGYEGLARLATRFWLDPEATSDGMTPLHDAARGGYGVIVQCLLQREAKVNEKSQKGEKSALHWVAEGGHEEVVRLLLKNGADVKLKAGDGTTALQLAEQAGHEPIVELLSR